MNNLDASAVLVAATKGLLPLDFRWQGDGSWQAVTPDSDVYEIAITDDGEAFCVDLPAGYQCKECFKTIHEAKMFCNGVEARRQH